MRKPLLYLTPALFVISAYDIYFTTIGLPIVPLLGFGLLVIAIILNPSLPAPRLDDSAVLFLSLAALTLLSSLWGLAYFGTISLKAPVGVLLGLLVARFVASGRFTPQTLYVALTIILAVHWGLWAFQFVGFFATGHAIDYTGMIGEVPTRSAYYGLTRFTGLFAEPAALALFMYMGVGARLVYNDFRIKWLDALCFLTIISTLSVSGYLLSIVLLAIAVSRMPIRRGVFTVALASLGLTALTVLTQRTNAPLVTWVLRRATSPTTDASGAVRSTAIIRGFVQRDELAQLFGIGVGDYEQSSGSVSGVQNLIEAFGFVGFPLFVGGAVALFLVHSARSAAIVVWGLSLLATAMWTVVYWWLWTGMLILFGSVGRRAASTRPPGRRVISPAQGIAGTAVLR